MAEAKKGLCEGCSVVATCVRVANELTSLVKDSQPFYDLSIEHARRQTIRTQALHDRVKLEVEAETESVPVAVHGIHLTAATIALDNSSVYIKIADEIGRRSQIHADYAAFLIESANMLFTNCADPFTPQTDGSISRCNSDKINEFEAKDKVFRESIVSPQEGGAGV